MVAVVLVLVVVVVLVLVLVLVLVMTMITMMRAFCCGFCGNSCRRAGLCARVL
jgi:hypothetical protein